MLDRRCLLLAVVLCAGLVTTPVIAGEADAYKEALWRLEDEFVRWADLEETGVRKGVPVETRGKSREDFISRLEFWEGEVLALDREAAAQLDRKIEAIRLRIKAWPGPVMAAHGSRGSARFRPVLPTPECTEAQFLGTETVSWATTDHLQRDASPLTAWFDASRLNPGWYRISTEGSTADTRIVVLDSCGETVLASNDDAVGLQARLAVYKGDDSPLLLRIEVPAFEGQQALTLTLEGAGAGGIAGIVRDESTGEPIDNVWMMLSDSAGGYVDYEWTSATGAYRFEGLDPGDYILRTSGTDDYLDELWDDIVCEESCNVLGGDRLVVDQSTVSGIDFDLSPGASVTGTVTDASGGLVTDGWIELHDQAAGYSHSRRLNSLGRFEFRGLTEDTYFLNTDLRGYQDELWDDIPCADYCEPQDGTPIALESLQNLSALDFHVQRLGTISGRLTDARTGLPVAGASVEIEDLIGGRNDSAYSDVLGKWRSGGLPSGSYTLYTRAHGYRDEVYDDVPCEPECDPEAGTPVALKFEQEISGIDFSLDPLGSISGIVFDEATAIPIADLQIEAWNGAGSRVETGYSSTLGRFELTALHPDTYYAVTDEDGPFVDELFANISCFTGPPDGCDPLTGTAIEISLSEDRSGIDFGLSRGAILAGSVTDEALGEPLAEADVAIHLANGALLEWVDVDAKGEYVVGGLAGGNYFIRTDSDTHVDQLWDGFDCEGGCDPTSGTAVPLGLGQIVGGHDFQLVLRGGLSGVVTDVSGKPVGGVRIHAWSSADEAVAAAATDAAGFYQIDLSSGFYYLSTDAPEGYVNVLWVDVLCADGPAIDGECDPLDGERITLVGAEPVRMDFNFVLQPDVFYDGFESGDLSGWASFED